MMFKSRAASGQSRRPRTFFEHVEGRALPATLVVNGDRFGPANDVILLHRNVDNRNFAEVQANAIVVPNTPIRPLTAIALTGLESRRPGYATPRQASSFFRRPVGPRADPPREG